MVVPFVLPALAAILAPLPAPQPVEGPFAEVSTNITLSVDCARLRSFSLELSLNANPSNNLEVAIGCDRDGDGRLGLLEADHTFGYDCGTWFASDTETGAVTEAAGAPTAAGGRVFRIERHDYDPSWNLLKVTRRGTGEIEESVVASEEHMFFAIRVR